MPKANSKTSEKYRYKTVNLGLFLQDGGFSKNSAEPGETIPPFEIITTSEDRLTNGDVFNDKPVYFWIFNLSHDNELNTGSIEAIRRVWRSD